MRRSLATTPILSIVSLVGLIAIGSGQQVPATGPAVAPATRPVIEVVPPAPPPPGAVLTDDQGKAVQGVRLAKADLRAVVRGPLAEVTVTLTFANNDDQVLGGELMFPLPDDATVTGYALDVNGSMVDGVAVDKQEARDIYRNESRRRVDPGLVEHIAGNAFHTRLYPIPGHGSRSARIQYLTEIACTGGGATLTMPIGCGNVDGFGLRIDAPHAGTRPAKDPVWPEMGSVAFHTRAHGLVREGELKEAADAMIVRLSSPAGRSVSIEQRPRDAAVERQGEGAPGGDPAKHFEHFEYYFLLNDTPPAAPAGPAPEAAAELKVRAARRVAILWDAGLSRALSDKRRELDLLDSLLKGWGGATCDLVVFRDSVEPPVSFDLGAPDGPAKVIDRLSRLTYDGASDLGHLPLPKNVAGFTGAGPAGAFGFDNPGAHKPKAAATQARKPAADYDCLLLFTDGIGGIGPRKLRKAEAPLYAFSDDPKSNGALLQEACRDSGGRYFNLRNFSGEARHEPWSLLSVDYKPDEAADVYPAGPIAIHELGRLTLTGRLLAPRATITLNYGYGNRVMHRQTFTLKIADASGGGLISRFWAQKKVADLSLEADLNQRELTRIGKRFNLVTPYTSLLVLETAAQYERYRVVPPTSRPQIYQEFVDKMGPVNELGTGPSSDESEVDSEEATGLRRVSTSGADRVVIMGLDPSREALRQALLGTVTVWDQLNHWWRDPKAFMAPPAEPPKDTLWDWSDPRTLRNAEGLANVEYAAKLRQSRELARDALRARDSGDLPDALYLYSQAVALNPGNTAAALRQSELIEGSAGQDRHSIARARLAAQARRRTAASASAFQAALGRAGQHVDQNDLAGADFEIDQARAALGDLGTRGEEDRKAFNAELADARHRVDAARLALARNARATREKLIFDAHFQGDANQMRVGVNRGGGYHRGDYGGGWAAGGNSGLFGGGGGGGSPGPDPPAGPSTPAATPLASIGAITPLASNIILPWDPEMPYLAALQRVPPDKAYDAYLEQRATFGRCPEFYLDCGDYLQRAGQHAMAVRVISDVAAFHLADPELLTRAAYRYHEMGEWGRAIELFERVLKMRPGDLQGPVNLALSLSDRADSARSPRADALAEPPALHRTDGRRDGERIAADYGRCLDLLNAVIVREARLSEVDVSCLMDANRVIARVRRLESTGRIPPVPIPLDTRLVRDLDCDLRVVVTSDTEGYTPAWTVTEPDGSIAQSGSYVTPIGGRIDGGEYCLRTLLPGLYRVKTIGFVGSRPARLTGVCTVRVTVFTNFGRATEKSKSVSLRMTSLDQKFDLGIVTPHSMAPVFQKPDNLLSVETSP